MLSKVRDPLFGDHDVWLPLEDVVTHKGDFLHFLFESVAHGVLVLELHVGLTFSLLILEGTVQKNNPGVSDLSSHLRVSNVLVDHHTVQNLAVIESSSWNLLNTGVSLDLKV